eukprot:5031-Heterococcus_DN1.PRE.2
MHERLDAYCDCNQYIGSAVIAASAVIRLYKQLTTAAAAWLANCSAAMMSMKTRCYACTIINTASATNSSATSVAYYSMHTTADTS